VFKVNNFLAILERSQASPKRYRLLLNMANIMKRRKEIQQRLAG
jgi:hypothetical protein